MYHHFGCTSIYRPFSYPFGSLLGSVHAGFSIYIGFPKGVHFNCIGNFHQSAAFQKVGIEETSSRNIKIILIFIQCLYDFCSCQMSVLSKILETASLIVKGQLFVSLRQILGYFTGNWRAKNTDYDKKSTITQNKEFTYHPNKHTYTDILLLLYLILVTIVYFLEVSKLQ